MPRSTASESSALRRGPAPLRVFGVLLVLYFLSRIYSLDVLPIFLDEAVHIQWAERLVGEGRILRPVGSGRLLAVVAYSLALPFDDRLWVARIIAALAGATTLVFTMLVSHRLFGGVASGIAGLLYLVSPFALVYDRLALSDGFLSASITGLMLATLAVIDAPTRQAPRLFLALLVFLAVVSKVSAPLFLFSIPLAVFMAPAGPARTLRTAGGAVTLGLVLASPMLWFFASNRGEISAQHLATPGGPGSLMLATLLDMREWVVAYFTLWGVALAAAALLLLRDRRALWLAASVLFPFLLFALFSQPWSARYVLPTLPPFLILISGGAALLAERLKLRAFGAVVMSLAVSLPFLSFDQSLLRNPSAAPFPSDDRRQLITGWPSGYGVRELAQHLGAAAASGPITVFLDNQGTRTVPTSLAILLGNQASVRLVEGDLASARVGASMVQEASGRSVFAVLGPRSPDLDFAASFRGATVERVEAFERPGGEWAATLFRLRR